MGMHINKINLLLFIPIIVATSMAVFAQKSQPIISSLYISGNRHISDETLVSWFSSKKGGFYSDGQIQGDLERVLLQYQKEGFYFADIDTLEKTFSSDSSTVALKLFITENDRLIINLVSLSGNSLFENSDILQDFNSKPNKFFNPGELENDIGFLLSRYENEGYPFAKANIQTTRIYPDKERLVVDVMIRIDEGDQITIDTVLIKGIKLTKPSVVVRESRIQMGEVFRETKMKSVHRRLQKMGIFSSVDKPELIFLKNGKTGVLINAVEANTNLFDGVIGYVPSSNASEKGFFTGLINISVRNLFGGGTRRIDINWEKLDENSQKFRIHYNEPWILGYPINGGIGFEQLVRELATNANYVERKLDLNFDFPLTETLLLQTQIGRSTVDPDSGGAIFLGSGANQTLRISGGIDYDTRDNQMNPKRGIRLRTSFEFGSKKIEDIENRFSNQRFELHMEFIVPSPFRRQVFDTQLNLAEIKSSESFIPISDQFRMGGARSLRGYREDQFWGSRVAWANVEYRFLIARSSRLFFFSDIGTFSREEQDKTKIQETKISYGFGLRLDSRLGLLGVDYGLGEGDDLTNGKIHFGLINEF